MASDELPYVKLFWLDKSRSQRILWLLQELKLPYELEIFHRDKKTMFAPPELQKVHPLGKSPVIQIRAAGAAEDADPITLAESGFITQYLAENVPEGKRLVPQRWKEGMEGKIGGETEAWMRYQYYLHYCEGTLMPPLVMALVVSALKSPQVPFFIRPISTILANRIFSAFIFPNTRLNLTMIEGHLATSGGKYICGPQLTAADILLSFPLIAAKDELDKFGSFENGSWKSEFPKIAECASQLRSVPASAKQLGAVASYSTTAEIPDTRRTRAASYSANASREPKLRPSGPRTGANAFRYKQKSDQDPALALFKDIVSSADGEATSNTEDVSAPMPVLNELEIVARLKEVMSNRVDPEERYMLFRDEIWPSIQGLEGPMPKHVYTGVKILLGNECSHMLKNGLYKNSLDIAEKYRALGDFSPSLRNDLILNMCARTTEHKNGSLERTELREEILKMWQHVSQLKRLSETNEEVRFALPSVTEVLKDAEYSNGPEPVRTGAQASRALASIFLQLPPRQALEVVPSLLATLAVASDKRYSGSAYKTQLAPLLLLVRAVLSKYKVRQADIDTIVSKSSSISPQRLAMLKEYVKNQWQFANNMITGESHPWVKFLSQDEDHGAKITLNNFHKQLRTAYRARNKGAIGSVWDAMLSAVRDDSSVKAQLAQDREFLDFWIFVWCAIPRPPRVQEMLDLMHSLGVEPTVRTYTSMMHGWKMCKDIAKIEALWSQLVKSGMKLDAVIWTERVSALIELGQHQKGLQALAELVGNWQRAVRHGRQAQAVEPTIEAVNAAFKSLLNADPKAAHELLAWAGKQGLEPNTRTYNILIRETIRMGHHEDVGELLRSMQREGIEPDSATFTILLEAVIGRMDDASAEEQVAAIKAVFGDIEEAGLKPNLETYGKMLYALDGLPNCSDDVISALQQHMRSNGFGSVLTPHMITILIERALRHDPPDINRVRSLLKENNLTKVSTGDQTLWERVMTAHAIGGDVQEAMSIFDDLAQSGRPVTSLSCLKELMQALLDVGDMESAKKVVDVVLKHKLHDGESKIANERYWRHHFWYLAQQNGLIDRQKLTQYARL
ncbi:glutathione S-transferase [Fusarium beomiforme]|uniref:Glutathione S-transferase n=1 Tax=Fusarium beomiforme TaxID=44412 RepID=A0A9P5A5Z7_9HYPO|nr:glutathione S-transferase [Fusarium beomiforme]